MRKQKFTLTLLLVLMGLFTQAQVQGIVFDVRSYGAKGDGKTFDTPSIIRGIPGHDIQDVKLRDIRIYCQGKGTKEQAAIEPAEKENAYPEPGMFGVIPSYGFFIRQVKGLEMNNVEISYMNEDLRPAFILNDVKGADFTNLKA